MHGVDEIAGVLARTADPKLIGEFLRSILTEREITEISGRWELVQMLDQGVSQRTIARQLGMSLCKITRGSKELKKPNSALKRMIDNHAVRTHQ